MLQLINITKNYELGTTTVEALKGINLKFRDNEFVSVLGPSGCGKTTMLNLLGGLDRYTEGDLIINRKSTKDFNDRDWDTYRNRRIGFVFQNYNLIPHQSVLSNVELALTLSGVSKSERRRRAVEVLDKVGLHDQLYKKPGQMSGGQMQRVSIARALINNPEILLADEPTGALDSGTSAQIMELIKEIAKERLVIMVTHNSELAGKYSTRIIKLFDGNLVDDSNPFEVEDERVTAVKKKRKQEKQEKKAFKKTSMSFLTALSLSANNLLTKKTRTFLTAFAGSIGIIGIALIMALSSGSQNYIDGVQRDTLSTYPIMIEEKTNDMMEMMNAMQNMRGQAGTREREEGRIYSFDIMRGMLRAMTQGRTDNDLTAFKKHIEANQAEITRLTNAVAYTYDVRLNIFNADYSDGVMQVNPFDVVSYTVFGDMGLSMDMMGMGMMGAADEQMSGMAVWSELIDNRDLLKSQYEVVYGRMAENYDEVVLITNSRNSITDYAMYGLGLRDRKEIEEMTRAMFEGNDTGEFEGETVSYSFEEILDMSFKLVLNTDYFEKTENGWADRSDDEGFMKGVLDDAKEIKIVGIIRPGENSNLPEVSGAIGYYKDLTEYAINQVNDSEIVKAQKADPETDIFTGRPFPDPNAEPEPEEFDFSSLSPEVQMMLAGMSEEEIEELMEQFAPPPAPVGSYELNLSKLGVADLDSPVMISLFPKDFESKEAIERFINDYNKSVGEESAIGYTDYVGLMMSSVSSVINMISAILMAFVGISLVVSSIMIGIITYVSVLERTREIGILKSIGASKRDISRVFNAETLIVGFVAGMLGILIALLLTIPANIIIHNVSGATGIAALPFIGGSLLVVLSMGLTLIAGLIPSRIAAKKDPVVALRTE